MNDNYHTDLFLMDLFIDWFDPCPLDPKPEVNGLEVKWPDRTFVNPPYSNVMPWFQRAIKENKEGKTIVMLLKMDSSTKWFASLKEAGARFLWVNKRLQHRTGKQANFPSMIAILSKYEI